MFSFFKKSKPMPIGDLYVHMGGEKPELFVDFDPGALDEIGKHRYATMRVIIVKPEPAQK